MLLLYCVAGIIIYGVARTFQNKISMKTLFSFSFKQGRGIGSKLGENLKNPNAKTFGIHPRKISSYTMDFGY